MMTTTELPRHPWLDELLADPQRAVSDLFSGRADKYPYARQRDAEFLRQVLPQREGLEREYDVLESGLLNWLVERRREDWKARTRLGLSAYVMALIEALAAVQMLELPRVAQALREQHNAYLRWLEPLRMGRAADPALELWRSHALLPGDHRFLPQWMRFCIEAKNTRPETYLTVALQGLRELPNHGDATLNLRYILRGLAERYLANRANDGADKEFKFNLSALRGAYQRPPQDWREWWDDALNGLTRDEADAVRDLLDERAEPKKYKPEQKQARALYSDSSRFPDRAKELSSALKSREPVAKLWPRIEALIADTLKHCNKTGESYYFTLSYHNLGNLVLKRAREYAAHLLLWLPDALQWKPDDPYLWMLWAQCLEAIDSEEQAEWVYWEMGRFFPNHEHSRVELARLLMRQQRNEEALALLREAADRNPDKPASRVELARLLIAQGKEHYPEAEQWLREAARLNPNNEPSRVELARLLMEHGKDRYPEAEAWLREAAERNPGNSPSRVELARLLMVQGKDRYPEAETWLRKVVERNSNDAHCHVELARLLFLSGNTKAAIVLLEEFDARQGGDKFVKDNLQKLRDGKTMNLPRLGEKGHEQKSLARKIPNVAAVTPAAVPDEYTQAAARATRAAFRMALQDQLAQQGRADLQQALADDPNDLLAAFYLDWAQCLPEGYETPPDAYALILAHAYHSGNSPWKELERRFPEQRRLTWGLQWMAALRDGGELPEDAWKQLEKLQQRQSDEDNSDIERKQHIQPLHAAGEARVAQLVETLRKTNAKPDAAWLDRQAQELLALTINRNLDPVAVTAL